MALVGLDTTFLVQLEMAGLDCAGADARRLLNTLLREGAELAIAFQVISEFVHVVTDGKRFHLPLDMTQAVKRAKYWWEAQEVTQIIPSGAAYVLTLEWLQKYGLGRKRLLDTQLAATYRSAGIMSVVSSNERDFEVFKCFKVIAPEQEK